MFVGVCSPFTQFSNFEKVKFVDKIVFFLYRARKLRAEIYVSYDSKVSTACYRSSVQLVERVHT